MIDTFKTFFNGVFLRCTNKLTNRHARTLLFFITIIGLLVVYINIITNEDLNEEDLYLRFTRPRPAKFDEFAINTAGCKIPLLDPYHLSLRRFIRDRVSKPLKCYTRQLIFVENNIVRPNFRELRKLKNVTCGYTPFKRKNEDKFKYYSTFRPVKEDAEIIDEFIMVECRQNKTQIYQDFFPQIIRKSDVEKRCYRAMKREKSEMKLSVLLLGIDSVAKTEYRRHLPRTDWFIRKKLSFIEFHGYNKIALNTFPNIMPLLTGNLEDDYDENLFETYLDFLPFIWKNFSKKGYRTLLAEDSPYMVAFNHAKKGFRKQPTDYYLRPFSKAVEKSAMKRDIRKRGCFHNRTESSAILKWMEDFFDKFYRQPVFAYLFLSGITHSDYNGVAYHDIPLLNTFERLYNNGHFNRTIVFFFSDHGYRFSYSRMTSEGHVEEKLPFFFIMLPEWFSTKYPVYYKNLKVNERRLVTTFDMHATLADVLNSMNDVRNFSELDRSVSLFTPISPSRTCQIANIDALYCTCADRHEIPKTGKNVEKAAELLVTSINNLTSKFRRKCDELYLYDILKATAQKFTTDIGLKNESYSITFQLTIQVVPGEAIFEGIVVYHGRKEEFFVDREFDRINLYGNQSYCVDDGHLKQFCYCNVQ